LASEVNIKEKMKKLNAYFGILMSRTFDICDELKQVMWHVFTYWRNRNV